MAEARRRVPSRTTEQPATERAPRRPLTPSALGRHQLDRFGKRTYVGQKNWMALRGVDVADEIDRINRGEGTPLGNNRWEINGRVYVDKGDRRAYPESGDRIITPSRLELIALRHLIDLNGDVAGLHERTKLDPNLDDRIRRSAKGLYDIWKEARDRES